MAIYLNSVVKLLSLLTFISITAHIGTAQTVSINDSGTDEGSNLTFTVTSTFAFASDVTFAIAYADVSTTSADYSGPATVTLLAGDTNVTFDVTAVDDDWVEETVQTFDVVLSEASGTITFSDDTGLGSITDTDIAYVVGGNVSTTEGGTIQYRFFLSTGTDTGGQQYVGIEDPYLLDMTFQERASSANPATDGVDFNGFSTTITFPANSPAGTEVFVPVPTLDDLILEPIEEFEIEKFRNPAEATKYGSAPSRVGINFERSVLRILDNDGSPASGLSVSDFTVNENSGTANFTVTYNGATVQDGFTVDYNITDGTAFSGADYTATLSGQLSFPAGTSNGNQQTITINISDDTLVEGNETLNIQLSNLSTTVINLVDADGTGTINDNDATPATGLSVTDFTIAESGGTADFMVYYNGADVQDAFTVDYTITDGTANSGSDYTATLTGQLAFPAGTSSGDSQTVSVSILDDAILEGNEDLNIALTNLSTTLINLVDPNAVGTINDDETAAPTDGLSVADFTVNENIGTVDFVVTYNGPSLQNAFTADYTITDGSAISGSDYTATLSGQVSFPVNTTNGNQQMVTLTINDDSLIEGNENLSIDVTNLSTTLINLVDDHAIGTITDNDIAIPTTGLSVADFSVNENAGTANFVVSYSGADVQDAFTVDYAITDVTASSGSDYTAALSGQLTFAAGTTNGDFQNITLNINDDLIIEGDETLSIALSSLSTALINLVDSNGVGTIVDNDVASPTTGLSVADFSVNESVGSTQFVVTYNGATVQNAFTVDYTITNGTATSGSDYFATLSGQLTFPAGTLNGDQQTVSVSIANDTAIEGDEDLNILLSNLSTSLLNLVDDTALGTIVDDDVANATTGLSIADFSFSESAGSVNFIITYNGANVQDAFTADYVITDGSALSGTDYNAVLSGQIAFPANTTNGSQQFISATILEDALIEGNETLDAELSNLSSSLLNLVDPNAQGTIVDNDIATPATGLEVADISVNEAAGSANFVVTYRGATVQDAFTVDFTISNGSAVSGSDYSGTLTGQLTFPAGTAHGNTQNIPFTIADDLLIEGDEGFSVLLSNLSTALINIVDGNANATIVDNDLATPMTGLSVADFTVGESAGTADFVVTYNGATVQNSFTVDYAISDVTTTFGSDYNATATGTITFPAGTSNGNQQTITVTINEDTFIEQNEELAFQLSNLSIAPILNIVDGNATGTINDNDNTPGRGIDFQNLSITVAEGDPGDTVNAVFEITLNGDLEAAQTVEVDYLANNGTAFNSTDFTASPTPATLTFSNTVKSHTVTIPLINDDVVEPTEAFALNLIAIRSNVGILLVNNSATATITDDDGGGVTPSGFSVVEQNTSANFEVQYNGDTVPGGFTVDYSITDGSATSGSDYAPVAASGTLVFPGNDNEVQSIAVNIFQDNLVEFDENIQITISNPSSAVVGITAAQADGIIVDNDGGSIAVTGFTVNELFTTENFEITYTGDPVPGGFMVNYQIVDGTTTQGSDYTVTSATGSLNFSGTTGEALQVPVDILQDSLLEGNETLTINITSVNPNLIAVTNSSATATIIDIDHQPTAVDDSFVVFQDNSNKTLDVLDNDDFGFDGPAASNALQVVTSPLNGSVTVNTNGTPGDQTDDYFDYAPSPSFNGNDSFMYSITDSNGTTVTATAYLYVNDTNLKRPFTIRYQGNVHGDFTMIANNVLSRNQTTPYNGPDGNHNFFDNVFVDIDSDPTTFNSTNANLVNPEPTLSCLNIEKVYIYWAAADKPYDGITGGGAIEPTWNYNEIKLMLPGESSYTTVAADEVLYRGRDEGFQNDPYVCVKDITAEVNALASPFGTYQVGNVKATEMAVINYTNNIIGTSGGWQIVFVYENISLDPKNITLYDGYVHTYASAGAGETEFNFSGFQTTPTGAVNTSMIIGSLEGDRDLGGDQFLINDTSNNWTNISTALRPANNFFNSRITLDGADFIDRNVASTNTLGFDAGKFELNNTGNALIGNDQTFARFRITTDQESYGLYLMGMSVDVYQPSLGALSLTANTTGPYNPGAIIPLTLSVGNVGNDDIQDLVITMTLPHEAGFSGVGTLPTGVTHSYDPGTRILQFDVSNGNIDMGDAFDIDFDIQLSPTCYYLETACTSSFPLQATATFSGVTNNDPITTNSSGTTDACGMGEFDPTIIAVQQPAQVNWATIAGDLDRTISCDNVTQLNAAQALEPSPASCSFILDKIAGTFVPSPACPTEGTYTNTWTFTDACGRISATYTQVITVEDTAAPTFNESLPADSFAAYTSVPSPQTLTANDNCDVSATVNFSESYIGDNTSTTYTIVRTWSTTDCAGNSTSHTQRIFITETGLAIGLSIDDVTVNEVDGTATLTVLNTGEVSGGFTVDFSTANGTAVQPGDYVQTTGTLNFSGTHNEPQTITATINDDNLLEPTEDLSVQLSNGVNTPTINDDTGIITINDNDNIAGTGVSFDSNNITITEGTNPVARFVIDFTGNIALGETVTVDYNTNNGTAIEPDDYLQSSGTITFSSTVSSVNIDIPIIDDSIIEPTENLILILSNVQSNFGVGFVDGQPVNTGIANILDNDNIPGTTGLSFQTDPVVVNEADGTATVNVLLTGNVQGGFTVDYSSSDGSAEAGSDYTAVAGTLTFAGNDGEMQPVTIPIIDDNAIEATETFFANLLNLSTSLIGINDSQANVNIIDNDNVPGTTGISFQADPVTVNEGDGTITINVQLTGNVQGGFTLDYASADQVALAGLDYTSVSGTLSFAGIDGEVRSILVPINDDNLIEPTERFVINLTNLSTTLINFNDTEASVDIIDNDNIPGTTGISFQNDAITVNEADGTATVNVLLTGNVQGGFTIDYTSANGTAIAGADYTAVAGTLTFLGNTGETHPITIPITDDNVIEVTERLLINLSNLSTTLIAINDTQATVDIIDNDNIPGTTGISFQTDPVIVNEADGTATLNVLLTGNVQGGFTLDYASADSSANAGSDYTAVSGTLTFAGNDGEIQPIVVPITDDTILEPTEQFLMNLLNLSTTLIAINDAQATVDILDNDNIPGTTGISFQNDAIVVNEGDGTATVNVLLTGNVQGGFTIDFDSADNTALAGIDYTAVSGTLTFVGNDGEIQPIVIPITDDAIIEPTEQLLIDLSNLSTGLIAINDAQATVAILDNDNIPGTTGISFQNDVITVNEADGTATVNVLLTGNVQGGFTIDFASADATAIAGTDYTAVSGTLNFLGNDGEIRPITIPIIDDNVIEPTERALIDLSNLSTTLIAINDAQATVDIIDNDNIPGTTGISFQNDAITVNEADGTATVNVLLTGNVQGGFTIDYTSANGTAIAGADYTAVAGTLTFLGNTGETHSITIPITDDNVIEVTERLLIDLSNLSTTLIAINDNQATVDIIDNDNIPGTTGISFQNDAITVNEADGTATVNVLLTGSVQGGFTLDYGTADGSAEAPGDYTAQSGTLTFAGNDGEIQPITITIIDDNLIEATERLLIDLSNLSTGLIAINDAQATVDILDNDTIPGTTGISFQNDTVTVNEGDGTMSFNVVLTGNVQGGFAVNYATTDGSASQPGDYTSTVGTLNFVGINTEVQTITIPIIDDLVIESTEDLTVTLSGLSTTLLTINGSTVATGNILDNDSTGAGEGISVADFTVNEAVGNTNFIITYTGPDVQNSFTVDFLVSDGTANYPSDYNMASLSGTITFPNGTTTGDTQLVTVGILDDDLIEFSETLNSTLSNSSNGVIGILDGNAVGTIDDNDAIPGVTGIRFDNNNVTVNEDAGTMTFDVALTGNVQGGFTVDYATTDGTAEQPSDYTQTTGTLTFVGIDTEVQTITIPIIDDNLIEFTEDLTVALSALSTPLITINGGNTATGNIVDNDAIPGVTGISFDSDNVTVDEDAGTLTFDVVLRGNVQGGFTVDYATTDGTAEQPSDYTQTIGTLTFVGNDTEVHSVTIPIIDDTIIEETESFDLTLSGLSTTLITINGPDTATGNIIDNDNVPGITGLVIDDVIVDETDGTAILTVTLTGNVQDGLTVEYTTVDDTAVAGEDFTLTTGVVTFAGNDGETQTISIPITNDVLLETDELFLVVLSNLSTTATQINDDTGSVTIIDDEFDTDGDSVPDIVDIDDDNDGILDTVEDDTAIDTDGDGYPDSIDIDSDNDGIPDNVEGQTTAGYIPPTGNDADNDGLDDAYEGVGVEGINPEDSDNDGIHDFRDLDTDNDTVPDNNEGNDFNFDGIPDQTFTGVDTDGDGLDDGYEGSNTNDGFDVNDEIDDPANDLPDTDQLEDVNYRDIDDDGDGVNTEDEDPDGDGDPTNDDTDGDGIPDYLDPIDTDGDDVPDYIDLDDDNDGVLDSHEGDDTTDTDGDGIIDRLDIDSDDDGIPDNVEAQTTDGYIPPSGNDADNDGLDDAYEGSGDEGIIAVDTDSDGTSDQIDLDSDNDNVPDNNEGNDFNFDGVPDQFHTGVDTDGDGLDDGYEGSDVNDGFDVNDEIDDPANDLPDTDGTEDVNYRDVDDDGDGIYTVDEDLDNDGDPTNDDTDGDGIPDYLDPEDDSLFDPNFEDITIMCGDEIPALPEIGNIGGCTNPVITFTEETILSDDTEDYMIERTWYATDECGNEVTFYQTIFVMQAQLEEIFIDSCVLDDPIDLTNYLPDHFDKNGTFTSITPGTYLNNTQFVPYGLVVGDYEISYAAVNGTCTYYADIVVNVNDDCLVCKPEILDISKTVTPNGDGINDFFKIRSEQYCEWIFDVMIFNRWGDKVYEGKNYNNDWDGTSPDNAVGRSGILPAGTYYYIIDIVGSEFKPINGYIYLGNSQ